MSDLPVSAGAGGVPAIDVVAVPGAAGVVVPSAFVEAGAGFGGGGGGIVPPGGGGMLAAAG